MITDERKRSSSLLASITTQLNEAKAHARRQEAIIKDYEARSKETVVATL